MSEHEHSQKSPGSAAGNFAVLAAFRRAKGTGAPSITPDGGLLPAGPRRPVLSFALHPLAALRRLVLARPLLATLGTVAAMALVATALPSQALAAGPPVIEEPKAENVTETTATIKAKIKPEGVKTFVYAEYNGAFTAPVTVEAGEPEQAVSFSLSGLKPGTTYGFRVFAASSEGTVESPAAQFKTLTPPPPHGEKAWWHLTSAARPSYLKPGVAQNEVQEILTTPGTVEGFAEQTDFKVFVNGKDIAPPPTSEFGTEELVKAFPSEVTLLSAENLQKALEAPAAYGPGNVTVKEETVDANGQPLTEGRKRYLVSTIGADADREVSSPMEVQGYESGAEAKVLTPGKPDGELVVGAENIGDATMRGGGCEKVGEGQGRYLDSACTEAAEPGQGEYEKTPIRILDTLPPGLEATSAVYSIPYGNQGGAIPCVVLTPRLVSCESEAELGPFAAIEVRIGVIVTGSAPASTVNESETNEIVAEGGQASPASLRRPVRLSGEPVPFGVEEYGLVNEQEGGGPDRQAGSHPFQQTVTINLNQTPDTDSLTNPHPSVHAAQMAKTLRMKWPAGLIGNPLAVPRCPIEDFLQRNEAQHVKNLTNDCPADTAVGVEHVSFFEPFIGTTGYSSALFDLEPQAGEAARFGFTVFGEPVLIDIGVRSGEDYGVTVEARNITQSIEFISSTTTVWGDPGAAVHASARGNNCVLESVAERLGSCSEPPQPQPAPFLALPTSCPAEVKTGIEGDSWQQADEQQARGESLALPPLAQTGMPALSGCNQLPFEPSIHVTPDGSAASSSAGMTVDVHVPQQESVNPNGLAESDPRDITVALPAGVQVNPSGGDGLASCSQGLVGFLGETEFPGIEGTSLPTFKPYIPGSPVAKQNGLKEPFVPGTDFCSDAAKIANVHVHTPLLEGELVGSVYLASQNENPFGSLIAMYIVAEEEKSGVTLKLPGRVQLCKGAGEPGLDNKGRAVPGIVCEAPGQLIATFEDNPQAPFEDAKLEFYGGERAPLATPPHCGAYTTHAAFTPWSAAPGEAPRLSTDTFNITEGPDHTPCPGSSLPFSPSLTGGSTNINAGSFSPLVTTISRKDGEQDLQSVQLSFPPGVSGSLAGVKLCPEAQANEGTCGPQSLIGETIVSAGVGSDPVNVTGGKVYITESYEGATFGLSIVNPVKAGPFDLEHDTSPEDPGYTPACDCVVVRGKLALDPVTAALTFTSDTSGPHAIPHLIDGIPVQIKKVNVTINRPSFTLNPTNCDPMAITGMIGSDEAAASPVSVPFQATNCAVLKYTPTLEVSTAAKASKTNGASLHFKIAYPKGAVGTQSWMKEMKFDIPKQLPARLTTIQKACLAKTFETNRSACPSASVIGHLIVHTPVLPVPLEGPLYFVSYGGAAFPDAVAVLHGYGITIESHGHTFINGKTGVTSATFESVPDVPFESIEVSVPQGPFSEFGANLPAKANDNFCGQKLVMPILFKAQNGMEIHRNVPVAVTGCGKARTRAQKLAAALKACHKKHGKKRASCEKAARKAYGAKASARKSSRKAHR